MGFMMKCDRCGRFIKNVSVKQLKTMNDDEVVCTQCVKVEDKCKGQVDKLKKTAEVEFIKLANKFKDQLQVILLNEVEKKDDKPKEKIGDKAIIT